MRLPLLESYLVMLPRLRAQDSLRESAVYAIGSGAMEKDAARRIKHDWVRDADPEARRRAKRPSTQQLASLPIRVRRVPVNTPKE